MKDLRLGERYAAPVTLALGFFDCVHLGHAAVISRATSKRLPLAAGSAPFSTFSNDPGALLGKKKRIYTFRERVAALDDLGADLVVHAPFDAAFSELSAEEFCRILTRHSGRQSAGLRRGSTPTAHMPRATRGPFPLTPRHAGYAATSCPSLDRTEKRYPPRE